MYATKSPKSKSSRRLFYAREKIVEKSSVSLRRQTSPQAIQGQRWNFPCFVTAQDSSAFALTNPSPVPTESKQLCTQCSHAGVHSNVGKKAFEDFRCHGVGESWRSDRSNMRRCRVYSVYPQTTTSNDAYTLHISVLLCVMAQKPSLTSRTSSTSFGLIAPRRAPVRRG